MNPSLSDGIALTGFSQNGSFVPFFKFGSNFISANQVTALSAYPNGYFAPGDPTGVQIDFFAPGSFDSNILTFAYSTGQPVAIGELLTFGSITGSVNNLAGPTLIITGERDIPYCGGNCLGGGNIPQAALQYFPKVVNPTAIVVLGWLELGVQSPFHLRLNLELFCSEWPFTIGQQELGIDTYCT